MPRAKLGTDVLSAAVERMVEIFAEGHRVVVSFSTGKDSCVAMELCLLAMREAGQGNAGSPRLDVVMRDEEILYPGSFEYAERVAARDDVAFHWIVANQPIVNAFDRANPYFWVFDPALRPDEWVRQPPPYAERIQGLSITSINSAERFPPPPGKKVFSVLGLRASESVRRNMGTHSKGGHLTRSAGDGKGSLGKGMWGCTPIYDWRDEDVWLFIRDMKVDYNSAYDAMAKMGVPKKFIRIAPPTLNAASLETLKIMHRAWPSWFDRVCRRLKGVRTAAQFGLRAVQPHRKLGETWQACFQRECIDDAPAPWIAQRARVVADAQVRRHAKHAVAPFPEVQQCLACGIPGSWEQLAQVMYSGDPFCLKTSGLPYMEPEFFRPGSGTWGGGKPTW